MSWDPRSGARSSAAEPPADRQSGIDLADDIRIAGATLLDALESHSPGSRDHADATASYGFAAAVELGLDGRYSGKITRGGPEDREITLRVDGHRAKLVKLPLVINCKFQTGERIEKVTRGGSGRIKQGYSHKYFNIHKRDKHFAGGTLRVNIGVDFHGKTMVGMFDANLDYGRRGSCGDLGYFRAKRR
jgi:hypothetical protein